MTQQDEMTIEDIIWSGGGAKSAEWPVAGSWVGGVIQSRPKKYQPTEYVKGAPAGSGKPRVTRDGRPVWGIRVDVQTSMRDPSVENDDGVRRLHLDKWRQHEALRHALQEAGVRMLEVGGELWMQWTGETSDGDGSQPAKTWFAKYRAPAGSVAGILDPARSAEPAPMQQPPAQPAPSWAQPAAQPPQSAPPVPMPAPVPAMAPAAHQAPPGGYPTQQAPVQPQGQNVITDSVAAALRAQGIDTSAFTVVPG